MLDHLQIKNAALIDELEIDFGRGLNILSGETGAGKSIIIDCINFVLGERAGKDFIRVGCDHAEVTALISVTDKRVPAELARLESFAGVERDAGEIVLSRSLNAAGRSVCKINGKTATASMLKEVSAFLADVHGQHEHQSLLNQAKHIELLDMFCGAELNALKTELIDVYRKYRAVITELRSFQGEDFGDKNEKIEIYTYQIGEIEAAKLREGEEEQLLEQRKVLAGFEKLMSNAEEANDILNGEGRGASVTEKLWRCLSCAKNAADIDERLTPLSERLEGLCADADDFARDFARYFESLEDDPEEVERVEERLDLIYTLKRKYGATIEDILAHLAKTKQKLEKLTNSEQDINRLNDAKSTLGKEAQRLCAALSQERKKAAAALETEILSVLADLGMKDAAFQISIERKEGFGTSGFDRVEFLISPNPGEPVKPLSKIASGGEMSRVMLALKTVLAEADSIETFIFDEIDTGVSGRAAQQVAQKLAILGGKRQILCITHLPQIAAMGDDNFLIEKSTNEETKRTTTTVTLLDKKSVASELARLTGGASITAATEKAAKEMKTQAEEFKKKYRRGNINEK